MPDWFFVQEGWSPFGPVVKLCRDELDFRVVKLSRNKTCVLPGQAGGADAVGRGRQALPATGRG